MGIVLRLHFGGREGRPGAEVLWSGDYHGGNEMKWHPEPRLEVISEGR